MNDFVTWELIGTFAGAVALTTGLTQVIKHYLEKIDPKWIALIVALLATVGYATVHVGDVSPQAVAMAMVNGLIVAGTSIGLFEGVKSFGRVLKKPE